MGRSLEVFGVRIPGILRSKSHIAGTSTMKSCRELAGLTTHEGLSFSDINVRNLTKILVNINKIFFNFLPD